MIKFQELLKDTPGYTKKLVEIQDFIAVELSKYKIKKKLSVKELAEYFNVSTDYVNYMLWGDANLSLDVIIKIELLLDIKIVLDINNKK
jgi:plasmid maintenance system antidote protein VapI